MWLPLLFLIYFTEQLDKTENEENEVRHARCEKNKDELSGESSSTILSEKGMYEER